MLADYLGQLQQYGKVRKPTGGGAGPSGGLPIARRWWAKDLILPCLSSESRRSLPIALADGVGCNLSPPAERPAIRPSPFDGRRWADVPPALQALADTGNPSFTPPELIAILGEAVRFRLPTDGPRRGMAVNKGGEYLAVPSGNSLAIFDARTGRLIYALPEHQNRVLEAEFSLDGRTVACRSYTAGVLIWDMQTGHMLRFLTGPSFGANKVAYRPDGKQVAVACIGHVVWLFDAGTGGNARQLRGHTGQANHVAFSPDGQWLASSSQDQTVRIWDVATRARLYTR